METGAWAGGSREGVTQVTHSDEPLQHIAHMSLSLGWVDFSPCPCTPPSSVTGPALTRRRHSGGPQRGCLPRPPSGRKQTWLRGLGLGLNSGVQVLILVLAVDLVLVLT